MEERLNIQKRGMLTKIHWIWWTIIFFSFTFTGILSKPTNLPELNNAGSGFRINVVEHHLQPNGIHDSQSNFRVTRSILNSYNNDHDGAHEKKSLDKITSTEKHENFNDPPFVQSTMGKDNDACTMDTTVILIVLH